MANQEVVNTILKKQLLEHILPQILPKYNDKFKRALNSYMVIIGGVSVEMCATLSPAATTFLRNVFSEDIDLKIVVLDKKTDLRSVDALRMRLLNHVLRHLNRFLAKHTWDPSIVVTARLDTSLMTHRLPVIRNAQIASVTIEYIEGKHRIEYPLLETSLFTHASKPHYHVFQNMFHTEHPVPYYTSHAVNYASCEYMLYDNCRMLVERANYLKEDKTLYALMKFIKHVIKFMALYVLRKKMKKLPAELNSVYEDAYAILQRINTHKIRSGLKSMHKIKYDTAYVDKVVLSLDIILKAYNLKSLIKASTKGVA